MLTRIWAVIIIFVFMSGCAVKPKFLEEQAQQEIQQRQEEWNWKNRHRLRQNKNHREEIIIIESFPGAHKKQKIQRQRQYRNHQLGLYSNRYNNNAKRRKHITPKKHNGVKIHKKNYWSKTTKRPQEDK